MQQAISATGCVQMHSPRVFPCPKKVLLEGYYPPPRSLAPFEKASSFSEGERLQKKEGRRNPLGTPYLLHVALFGGMLEEICTRCYFAKVEIGVVNAQ